VGPSNQPDLAKFLDLQMLVVAGGLERSESDWHRLLATCGFRLERIIPMSSPESILEATPT
jgi:hypothetical protein